MAMGDKLVNLDDLKAAYDNLAATDSELKSAINALKNATTELFSIESVLKYCNFTSQKIDYWESGAYRIAYIPCEPNKIYRITKDVDTTRFDIAYIKTTPAVNVPVYGYEELQGTVSATDYVTGNDAAYLLVQTKGSPDHVSFFEYIITTNDEQSQEIQNIEDDIQNIENEINGNLTVPIAGSSIIQGTYSSIDGALVANAGRIRTSGFMRMYKGQKIKFEAGTNTTQIFYGFRAVGGTSFTDAAWMGDGDVISIPADWEIILVFRKNANNDNISPADFDATVTIIPSLETDLTEYKSYIKGITDDTVKLVSEEKTENITPDLIFTSGYVATDGSIGSSPTLKYTNKIAVSPGDVLEVTVTGSEFRFVCAYNNNTAVSASGAQNTASYTVPEGINYVRLTTYTQYDGEPIYHTTTETKYKNIIEPIPMGYMTNAGGMAPGDKLYLPTHNVKNRNRYVFNANITAFSAIKFAKDDSLIVDDTNITVTNSSGTTTIPHGLTISHDITLIVENEDSYTASLIRVASAGNVFSYTTPIRFLMDENAPYIESQGSTLVDCRFSWVSENINQPIWLFGDSYFSWYDVRWTYYAAEDGYLESALLNGYAGQASASAMTALKNLLEITTPKIVVWCLGMNDGDSESAVNASWYANYQKLKELSETYGFEIVLYTTPTTPTIDNSYKNAIVRESGYRYIEADLAVRIDAEGHWVTGALSGDNVHPTEIGAKILYYRFLADLPELMSLK